MIERDRKTEKNKEREKQYLVKLSKIDRRAKGRDKVLESNIFPLVSSRSICRDLLDGCSV